MEKESNKMILMKIHLKRLLLFLWFFLTSSSCQKQDESILLSEIFSRRDTTQVGIPIKVSAPIVKKTSQTKSILIGDSNVFTIKATTGFQDLGVGVGFAKSGINTKQLAEYIRRQEVDTNVLQIFVAIGTNDAYRGENSKVLWAQIRRVYPKADSIWVIWGSRGWGSTRNCSPKDQELFYQKFSNVGFNQIPIYENYFPTDALAHKPNQKYQLEIVKKIAAINGQVKNGR